MVLLFDDFKNVAPELRKEIGQQLNELKNKAQDKINTLKEKLEGDSTSDVKDIDLTLPAENFALGSRHPLSLVRNQIVDIFSRIGFTPCLLVRPAAARSAGVCVIRFIGRPAPGSADGGRAIRPAGCLGPVPRLMHGQVAGPLSRHGCVGCVSQ